MGNKYRKHNPKYIALIVEIVLLVVGFIIVSILSGIGISINYIPVVIVTAILMFSFVLTLSLLRYDAMRDIRADDSFKKSNLPLFTDPTALQGHDIVEERDNEKDK